MFMSSHIKNSVIVIKTMFFLFFSLLLTVECVCSICSSMFPEHCAQNQDVGCKGSGSSCCPKPVSSIASGTGYNFSTKMHNREL